MIYKRGVAATRTKRRFQYRSGALVPTKLADVYRQYPITKPRDKA
jgi:hypothetical protein